MNELPQLREALMRAAREQLAPAPLPTRTGRLAGHAPHPPAGHWARAVLASLTLGLAASAIGAVEVGAPLGPERSAPRLHAPGTAPTSDGALAR